MAPCLVLRSDRARSGHSGTGSRRSIATIHNGWPQRRVGALVKDLGIKANVVDIDAPTPIQCPERLGLTSTDGTK
jgi:hypothetical protein